MAGQQVSQLPVDAIEHARGQEQVLNIVRLTFQHLGEEVLGHRAVAAGELGDERSGSGCPASEIAASRNPATHPSVR